MKEMDRRGDKRIKVSVIIPVWNPGPGISRCIKSLREQTLKEIEMIFVDDCGTDDSMEKVRAQSDTDPRIRILNNEKNTGPGASRNRGIEEAEGEYLSFVDPDDYVAPDFLEILYAKARSEDLDIVKGTCVRVAKDGSRSVRDLNPSVLAGLDQGLPLYLLFTYEHQSAIYKRDFITSNLIRYGSSRRAQDHVFLLKAAHAAKTFAVKEEACYYFCEREDSALHTLDAKSLQGCADAVAEQIDYVLDALPRDEYTEMFLAGLFNVFLREYARYDGIPDLKEEADHYLGRLRTELLRLPFCDSLARQNISLRILRDYGAGLPIAPYHSPWEEKEQPERSARLMKKWLDFFAAHPEVKADGFKCER